MTEMTRTREDFCRGLLDDDSPQYTLDPERLAARFVRYFRVSGRPTMPELTGLMEEAGFGTVEGRHLDSMKGVHVSAPGGGYNIYYRQDLWDGAAEHTMLHEAYETLCDMESNSPPERKVCREADRFAAAALMQPQAFSLAGRAVGAERARLAANVPLLLRLGDPAAGRGHGGPPPDDGPLRAGGEGRPRRLGRAARAVGDGGAVHAGIRESCHLPHLRRAGRRSPAGQAPFPRLPGGAGRSLLQHPVCPRGRLRRHSPARSLEGAAGEGRGRRRARRGPGRSRPPAGRLRPPGAQAASGGGWSLVVECERVFKRMDERE